MKQLLTILTILMLLLPAAMAAPPVPKPMRGYFEINGAGTAGYIIEVENLRTGEVISGDTINSLITQVNGFAFDLSYLSQGALAPVPPIGFPGDIIEVRVRGFGDEGTLQFYVPENTPYEFTINIETTSPPPPQIYVCPDGSQVSDPDDCLAEPEPEPEVEPETKVSSSGSSASVDVYYGVPIEVRLDDNKLSKLIDSEIKYDGEEYEVHEEIYFKGIIQTSLDDEDFGLESYLVVQEGALEYRYVFDDMIPIDDIHLEEPLEITFLGKDVKIIEAYEDEFVLRSGEDYFKKEGDSFKVLEHEVTVVTIGEDSVLIEVDGTSEIVIDGNDREINGLSVLVESILYKNYEGPGSYVELVIGLETDVVIKNGDDFELFIKDSEEYEWVISLGDSQYIGIISKESYLGVDEDDDYHALGVGDSIVLPNGYVNVRFDSVTDVDMNEISFKVKDGYLYVRGEDGVFNHESTDYDRLYINEDGIYDEDKILITTDKVEIGDSGIYLEMGSVKIKDLTILLDLADILYKGISYATKDENFMDYLGIIFKDPENAVEDKDNFKVIVPEERPEALITFGDTLFVPAEPVEEEEEETDVVEPVDPTPIPTPTPVSVPQPIPTTTPDPTPVADPVPSVDEDEVDTLFDKVFSLAVKILAVFGFGAGFLGLVNHYWKGGQKIRAIKMLNTAISKALLGKYDKYKK